MPQPHAEPVIRAFHVISTGGAAAHPEHLYGSRLPRLYWALTSRRWIEVPINVFVIEHARGTVLFDSGLDPAIATDPNYVSSRIGRFFLRRLSRCRISPDEGLGRKLGALGVAPASVRKVVISHLHWDHIGGIADVPEAELFVSKAEWAQLSLPHPERAWVFREHIELRGARWHEIDFTASDDPLLVPFGGSHDLMGDGSLAVLPTPGHTPGSLSLLVQVAGRPPILLIGDLAYDTGMLLRDELPGTGDPAGLRASYAKVRALKQELPDLVILPAHDPSSAERLAASGASG